MKSYIIWSLIGIVLSVGAYFVGAKNDSSSSSFGSSSSSESSGSSSNFNFSTK